MTADRLLLLFLLGLAACSGSAGDRAAADGATPDAVEDVVGADVRPDAVEGADLRRPDIVPLLEEARFWLSHGEPQMALALFEEVLEAAPDDPDAIFGAGLAQFIHASEFLAMITNMPAQFLGYVSGDGTREPESMNEAIAEQLAGLLVGLNERFARAEDHLSRITSPDFEWTIERAPLYYVTRPMLMYRGRFDLGDVAMIRAVNGLCRWITALLAAQDLSTDFSYAMVVAKKIEGGGADPILILEAAAYIIETSPAFLGLSDTVGDRFFEEGGAVMRDVGRHILDAVAWLEDEDSSDQDVSRLEWDAGERVIVIHNRVVLDGYEGVEEPLRVRMTQDILDATADLVAALETPGEVVPFSVGPGLQLATILGIAAKLGIIDQMGISLPLDITHLEIDQILTLLSGFLPDVLGFDWAGFHEHRSGLRALLPLISDPADPDGLLLSWECPGDLWHDGFPSGAGRLLCGEATLVDSPHFEDTPWEMAADGHLTKLPYMIWEDPTLAGLVYVDATWPDDGPPDWQAPDNLLLNTGLHLWLDAFMGLL